MQLFERTDEIGPYVEAVFTSVTFLVDAEDVHFLFERKWHSCASHGHPECCYLLARDTTGKTIVLHRLILDAPKGMTVDHIDGNSMNNRRHNLRLCTLAENIRNRHRGTRSATGRRGVYQRDDGSYYVVISINGKGKHMGTYHDLDEATAARDAAAIRQYGKFAWLNNP